MFVRVDILAQNRLAQGEPCGCVRQKVYLSLGARGSQSAKSEIISPYCGKVDITIARVRVYDMLGLFCLPVFHPQKQAITASAYVLPQLPEVLPLYAGFFPAGAQQRGILPL